MVLLVFLVCFTGNLTLYSTMMSSAAPVRLSLVGAKSYVICLLFALYAGIFRFSQIF